MTNILPTYLKHRIDSKQTFLLQPEIAGENFAVQFQNLLAEIHIRFNNQGTLISAKEGFFQEITFVSGQPIDLVNWNPFLLESGHFLDLVSQPDILINI